MKKETGEGDLIKTPKLPIFKFGGIILLNEQAQQPGIEGDTARTIQKGDEISRELTAQDDD